MVESEREGPTRWHGPSPEQQQATFETLYSRFAVGEVNRRSDDGTETTVRAYELIVDAGDPRERQSVITSFGLRALEAGYREALSPLALQPVGYKDAAGRVPLTAVYFFLETPARATL